MALPLSEKYRPGTLAQLLGNREVASSLNSLLASRNLPNMLFYGPPGCGKTTAIRALAKELYGPLTPNSVLELNASDERGIDVVRDTIKEFSITRGFTNEKRLVILDEADSMSRDAQNCMRRVIEDFSNNVRFCFVCNYAGKIIPAIQSRCTKFRFAPVCLNVKSEEYTNVFDKIKTSCELENISCDDEGINAIILGSDGDVRKMMNDIGGVAGSFQHISAKNVYMLSNIVEKKVFEEFFAELQQNDFRKSLTAAKELKRNYSLDCESLVIHLSEILVQSNIQKKMEMLRELSNIQYRLGLGCSEDTQLNALIGLFISAK